MKAHILFLTAVIVLAGSSYGLAAGGESHHGSLGAMMNEEKTPKAPAEEKAVDVGNKICPVSGEKIGDMGPGAQYEYKGKIYNFCCTGCIEEFKKDPEKYVKVVEGQMAEPMGMDTKGEQPMMEKAGEHMMMNTEMSGTMQVAMEKAFPAAPVKDFDLKAFQFGYSPETITVNKGDVVKIHATSGDVPHGVMIKEYGINVRVEKEKPQDIQFVADKSGEFDIVCSVYCGSGHAMMKAKLIVKE